jgi:bifunctional DNA-binding transcriptional regulator/antitoxin component of YhaV-PrlF toxin-antitoxin module
MDGTMLMNNQVGQTEDKGMTVLKVGSHGEVTLPDQLRDRYGVTPATPLRVVETRGGILLIPQTGAPLNEELARELDDWQALGADAWSMFPYEDEAP